MTPAEAVTLLRAYNQWRRWPANAPESEEPPMPNPYDVGVAIDVVCEAVMAPPSDDGVSRSPSKRHNLEPKMNHPDLEQEIQAKGLTAPRVTPEDLEANIASEVFFTAEHGVEGAMARGELWSRYADASQGNGPLRRLTFCIIVMRNGFAVTGESACVSAANFDPEIGRRVAREDAVSKIWALMGYALRDRLAGEIG